MAEAIRQLRYGLQAFLFQMELEGLWEAYEAADEALRNYEERIQDELSRQFENAVTEADHDALDGMDAHHTRVTLGRIQLRPVFVVAFYHLWEQHVVKWTQQKRFDHEKAVLALNALGAALDESALDEARLIANSIKHGDGPSAQELYKVRPDLFSKATRATTAQFERLSLGEVDVHRIWKALWQATPRAADPEGVPF